MYIYIYIYIYVYTCFIINVVRRRASAKGVLHSGQMALMPLCVNLRGVADWLTPGPSSTTSSRGSRMSSRLPTHRSQC